MKYNEYINDFGYYLNLVLNWDVKKTVLDFNKPFKRLSLSQNDHILRKWNKFGFRPLFKTFSFWTFFGFYHEYHANMFKKTIYVNKKGTCFIMKDLSDHKEIYLFDIKLSKKTGRCIGYTYANEWEDLFNKVTSILRCSTFPIDMIGHRWLPFDKNFKNLSVDNLVPVPKGITIKQVKDATSWQKRFEVYPDVENMLLTLDQKDSFRYMLSQPDKVWLNHNIVCIIMDKFTAPLLYCPDEHYKLPSKSHYYLINEYARKFGFYPTVDRIVLSFWNFRILFYSTISFFVPDNINVEKILI